jgi:hypothetical protein
MPSIRTRFALSFAALATAALCAFPAQAAKTEVKGAAILEHPLGKLATQNMALMAAGKIEDALKMSSKAMNAEFAAMPADDRKSMSEMMKAFSVPDAEFRAKITKFGVLVVEDTSATLTITEKVDNAQEKSTGTMTQRYVLEDGKWKIGR